MYRTILVPLDGSELSQRALPWASDLARRSGATVLLVHVHVVADQVYIEGMPVIDEQLHSLGRIHERAYLEQICATLSAEGVVATWANPDDLGSVAATLAAEARSASADLVVMTTHGRGGLERMWLGSVTDALVRISALPILLLRPKMAFLPPKRLLIPLDGSPLAEQIMAPAEQLAQVFGAQIELLQVVRPDRAAGALELEHQRVAASSYLAALAGRLRHAGLQPSTHVLTDEHVAAAILAEADTAPGSLIAIATNGRSGAAKLLLGSVADKLLRGATTPLLLLRPRAA